METVAAPFVRLVINDKDVTDALFPYLMDVKYQDAVKGKSDNLMIRLSDPERLFSGPWYPAKGQTVEVTMGYAGDILPGGLFTIDETEYYGPPAELAVKALAASMTQQLRTPRSVAHEDSSLLKIASTIAERHGLRVQGDIQTSLQIGRAMQYRETDLGFLARMAGLYGYVFSIRGDVLYFSDQYGLEDRVPVDEITPDQVTGFSFTDKSHKVPSAATNSYFSGDFMEGFNSMRIPDEETGRPDWYKNGDSRFNYVRRNLGENNQTEQDSLGNFPSILFDREVEQDRSAVAPEPPKTSGRYLFDSSAYNYITRNLGQAYDFQDGSSDMLLTNYPVTSEAENDAITQASLHGKRTRKITCSLQMVGNTRILAGNNINLIGFGDRFDGRYHIESTDHSFAPERGYSTSAELKKLSYRA